MQRKLVWANAVVLVDVLDQGAGMVGALPLKHLPAHDVTTKDVHK